MPQLRASLAVTILNPDRTACRRARERVMPSVVNLNRFRKAKKAAEAERRAAENRAAFGRSKTERAKEDGERQRSERDLDGKHIE